jgi:hypothetical protein
MGMGRRYAGILGTLAFSTVLVHGVTHDAGAAETLLRASGALVVMAGVGAIIGALAGWTVAEAVRASLIRRLTQPQATDVEVRHSDGLTQ